MAYLFDFNTILGRMLFIIVILIATQVHVLAGVLALMLIISFKRVVIEGMASNGVSSKEPKIDEDAMNSPSSPSSPNTDSNDDGDIPDHSPAPNGPSDSKLAMFKVNNCSNGMLMKDGKEVPSELIKHIFPNIKFLGDDCNPCDDDCKFEVVSSAERLTAEKNVTPVEQKNKMNNKFFSRQERK
jgi:hypothetical protein